MKAAKHNSDADLALLLGRMYKESGLDFRGYKVASIRRRIGKRLHTLNISSYQEYLKLLESDPSEYHRLLGYLTIKVSAFFREPEVFHALSRAVGSAAAPDGGLRAWCCGCANGEEAYSLAMLLTQRLGAESLRRTKIFATDIDSGALANARGALYGGESMANVSSDFLERYFVRTGGAYKVKYHLRNIVRVGRLDIVNDRPLTNMQVLFCRNLFIYFNKELQESVFEKLDYALRPGGVLVLGRSEVVPQAFSRRYDLLSKGMSVYRKTG